MEGGSPCALAGEAAAGPGPQPTAAEAAAPAPDHDMGDAEPGAPAATFDHLAERRGRASTGTLPGLPRLPRRDPKAFDGFDLPRMRGRDAGALARLPAPADPYARRDVASMGPGGIGKARLARACGRECRMRGLKTHHVRANEPGDGFQGAAGRGGARRAVATPARPSRPIVDEVGRCVSDRACADLLFDVIDRHHEREGPNTMTLTSNMAPSSRDEALLCALDRASDKASVFMMRGPSYRGRGLDTHSVEAVPQATKVRGMQPEGVQPLHRLGNRLPAHWPESADRDWRLSPDWMWLNSSDANSPPSSRG